MRHLDTCESDIINGRMNVCINPCCQIRKPTQSSEAIILRVSKLDSIAKVDVDVKRTMDRLLVNSTYTHDGSSIQCAKYYCTGFYYAVANKGKAVYIRFTVYVGYLKTLRMP